MKRLMKCAFVVALLAVFASGFAVEASAAQKPSWLVLKVEKFEVRENSAKGAGDPGRVEVLLTILHTNKSKDRIVTALYDKKVTITVKETVNNKTYAGFVNSAKVNRVNLDPGQGVRLVYTVPIIYLGRSGKWEKLSNASNFNRELMRHKADMKLEKWTLDLQVKSEDI